MIDFFIENAPSFLTVGITALIALFLRVAAQRYADRADS